MMLLKAANFVAENFSRVLKDKSYSILPVTHCSYSLDLQILNFKKPLRVLDIANYTMFGKM